MTNALRTRCRCGTALKKKEIRNPLFVLLAGRGGVEEAFCSKICLDSACTPPVRGYDDRRYELPLHIDPG